MGLTTNQKLLLEKAAKECAQGKMNEGLFFALCEEGIYISAEMAEKALERAKKETEK